VAALTLTAHRHDEIGCALAIGAALLTMSMAVAVLLDSTPSDTVYVNESLPVKPPWGRR